jgi:hypothetical protein
MKRLSVLLFTAFVVTTASARAAEPIEGVWAQQGVANPVIVRVAPDGSGGFRGVVLTEGCGHPVGQVMWQMTGGGTYYTGTHMWQNSCLPTAPGNAAFRLVSGGTNLFWCTAAPGSAVHPQIDAAGNPTPSDAACTTYGRSAEPVVPDTTPPDTTIDRVRIRRGGNSIRVSFSSTESGSNYRCKLDHRRWLPCASPHTFHGVGPGRHHVKVRAIDSAGNADPSPADRSVRI